MGSELDKKEASEATGRRREKLESDAPAADRPRSSFAADSGDDDDDDEARLSLSPPRPPPGRGRRSSPRLLARRSLSRSQLLPPSQRAARLYQHQHADLCPSTAQRRTSSTTQQQRRASKRRSHPHAFSRPPLGPRRRTERLSNPQPCSSIEVRSIHTQAVRAIGAARGHGGQESAPRDEQGAERNRGGGGLSLWNDARDRARAPFHRSPRATWVLLEHAHPRRASHHRSSASARRGD